MATLVLFSGLPGSGKSTLAHAVARERGWTLLSKDHINRSLALAEIEDFWAAYHVMFGLARLNLGQGISVVLDANFRLQRLRDEAMAVAADCGAACHTIVCTCSDETLWQERFTDRVPLIEGWPTTQWQDVERIRRRFAVWEQPNLLLDTAEPIERSVRHIRDYLDGAESAATRCERGHS